MMKIFFMVNLVASILAINLCKSIQKKKQQESYNNLHFELEGVTNILPKKTKYGTQSVTSRLKCMRSVRYLISLELPIS